MIKKLFSKKCIIEIDFITLSKMVECSLKFVDKDKYIVKRKMFVCSNYKDLISKIAGWEDVTIVDCEQIRIELIMEWILQIKRQYKIKFIAIDSFRYSLLASELNKIGFDKYKRKNLKCINYRKS